ncbi:hypothetical protein BDQ12DRAFT_738249 [Crucibulum laeve]|uniref:Protein kinase domain-containing protein n=1 Tax=Crucibulum laeve TaxID=68775 RepID=A0A5C3LNK3_9AGAR|nr:hypothetical protein BDQ12DRAFT_738249 [Crucibulum laeve]
MSPRLALFLPVLLTVPAAAYALCHVRIIQLKSLRERIVWTFRSWHANYPVPLVMDRWQFNKENDFAVQLQDLQRPWMFLQSFFASRGYALYCPDPLSQNWDLYPALTIGSNKPRCEPQFPYALRLYTDDKDIMFAFFSPRVWPARDAQGRDVVIRLVSGRIPSDELKILQRLNTPKVRADPRNHSIYALDYISFDGLVFVIMPRWDNAFGHDFHNVQELMHFTDAFLEGIDFLHEHRIVHCDFSEQNTGMNVLTNVHASYLTGLRDLCVSQYAIYDFGWSLIYPYNTVLEDVTVTTHFNFSFHLRGLLTPSGPHNPFQVDVLSVGLILLRWVRHIEDVVPDIGPFFDSMVTSDTTKRFTARQALLEFRKIHSRLSLSQLDSLVTGRFWDNGRIKTKLDYPTQL